MTPHIFTHFHTKEQASDGVSPYSGLEHLPRLKCWIHRAHRALKLYDHVVFPSFLPFFFPCTSHSAHGAATCLHFPKNLQVASL